MKPPFSSDFARTSHRDCFAREVLSKVGETVRLAGAIERKSQHGGVSFLLLRDPTGCVQVVLEDGSFELDDSGGTLRKEAFLSLEGEVQNRAEGRTDPKLETGSVEVRVRSATVHSSPSEDLPFVPSDQDQVGEETRLTHRVLSLRNPEVQARLRLRARLLSRWRTRLEAQDFAEVETPVLTRATPEGARDFLVPSRTRPGDVYALPQSPQIFKQLLMMSGWERYFQVCRCFRDEDLRADRQPEFTQLDLEASFLAPEDLQGLVEALFQDLAELGELEFPEAPFPRISFSEALERFGSDAPDLRWDQEILNLDFLLERPDLDRLRAGAKKGLVLRALRLPGGGRGSKKDRARWIGPAPKEGHPVQWLRFKAPQEPQSSLGSFLADTAYQALAEASQLGPEDLVFFLAGPRHQVLERLGELRSRLIEALVPTGQISLARSHALLWVTDFPWLEASEEEGRWIARHHPFTAPHPEDFASPEVPLAEKRALAYDLVWNGKEVGGGSVRIHQIVTQARMFDLLGISANEAESRFGFLLRALRQGAPPHLGMALGVDRILALATQAKSLKDVIAFPKTADGACLLSDAPSRVDAEDLLDLGLKRIPGRGKTS